MSIDILAALLVAGGSSFIAAPVVIDGCHVEPPTTTLSSQVTGDDTTTLYARITSGRVKLGDASIDLPGEEVRVGYQNGSQLDIGSDTLASGYAVWYTAIAIRHRKSSAIEVVWVNGSIAAVASAVVATEAEIRTALGLDDHTLIAILGDIRFHRSADTVIDVKTTGGRRPAYVETTKKTTVTEDAASPDGMEEVDGGYIDIPVTLASAYALTAADLYAAIPAPRWAWGGLIYDAEYIGEVSGANSSAEMQLKLQIDGVEVTGSALALTLANTAIAAGGCSVAAAGISAANIFKPDSTIGLEVDSKTTAFTAGSGVVRCYLRKYVPVRP